MDQKEVLRQEIEQKLRAACNQLSHIKTIMGETSWDFVSEKDVDIAFEAITDLMLKFKYTKG